ncbi:MAG TPA: RpiB/LacA/LacB family sugar-phosphate isomerase [Candidatus Saccharimonadales bacterium]|nr:RpiB/LacA/LacB family sugar-phosphate isomerase [Candidatus Saccharimonadales bacterium]
MKVFLAADHAGFELKKTIKRHLEQADFEVEDLGPEELDKDDDYPVKAYDVATKVLGEDDARGILVCSSGQGMAIAANRLSGIRASVIWSVDGAKETRLDNDSNVLSLPAQMIDEDTALKIIDTWLATKFSGEERHLRRIKELEDL